MKRDRNLKKPVFWTLLLTFGLWTIAAPGQSDSELPSQDTGASTASDNATDPAEPPTSQPLRKTSITADTQEEKAPTFMETIDQLAGTAVDHIAAILFRKVGSSERKPMRRGIADAL